VGGRDFSISERDAAGINSGCGFTFVFVIAPPKIINLLPPKKWEQYPISETAMVSLII